MSTREHLYSVVATLQPVIHGVSDQQLGEATPCPDFDVRRLVGHLSGTVEAMRRVGAGEPLDAQDPWGTSGAEVGQGWRHALSQKLRDYAEAWSQPESWEGEALDGAMTRQAVGDMGYVEVMLHGWDLARGTGQDLVFDDAAADRALEVMDEIGEQGRTQGAFGPEVSVSEEAPAFARALGKAGRDPEWSAG